MSATRLYAGSLAEYKQRCAELLATSAHMDETNTKAKLITPLFKLLGWPVDKPIPNGSVEMEYKVQAGSSKKAVDYAFIHERVPEAFVETKANNVALTEDDRVQLSSYMRIEGAQWGLLTNGTAFEVYTRKLRSKKPDELLFTAFERDEIVEYEKGLSVLTFESIASGRSEEVALSLEDTKSAVAALRDAEDNLTDDVLDALDPIDHPTHRPIVEAEVEEFITRLQRRFSTRESELTQVTLTRDHLWEFIEQEGGMTVRENGIVANADDATPTDCFRDAIIALIDEGYITQSMLPVMAGKSRVVVNSTNQHTNGTVIRGAEEVRDGFWIDTNYDTSKKAYLLGEIVDHILGTT